MQNEFSAEQQKQLLEKLIIPFHPDAISWRVTNKSKDGKRGCVIPYGDQRAYTDRLNEVFTPAGWTRAYDVTPLSPVTRTRKNVAIQTGKVIVTCVVTIHGLGSHSGSGEMWADDDNAMTRAEAQAFKRACCCFGLGRYFYEFAEMWVDLDDYGNPLRIPTLPKWALPAGVVPTKAEPVPVVSAARSQPSTAKTTENAKLAASGLDAGLTQRIESFRQVVGDALYFEVFRRGGPARNARELPSVGAQNWVVKQLETLDRGIQRVRVLAEDVHENVFYGVLDAHRVQSIDKIPSFEVLKAVVTDLQNATQGVAA
ncbi:Rad52/22 family double-strand break repair protein [Edaphobacter aggregans]|uniref:Rad52/22 family double-strand break repair protein n=1 Tax=Edaphobacter aggregans TaxID=570835 RepID=A0A428MNU5_9BACT|nr:Rad52/Rad22 family DNA repair protein [Edaphobacter aggregans]RSL18598.1 Rad52/22 family double-strand break repair protein [Edaphobacter aggregans]